MMEAPDRMPDGLNFWHKYVPSDRTQKVNTASSIIPGGRFTPPVVNQWTEREEPVPGYEITMVTEYWFTWKGLVGRTQPYDSVESQRREAWNRLAVEVYQSKGSEPGASGRTGGLFWSSIPYGWGYSGSFRLEDRYCTRLHTETTVRHSIKDACPLLESFKGFEADPLILNYGIGLTDIDIARWERIPAESGPTGNDGSAVIEFLRPKDGLAKRHPLTLV